MKHHPYLHRISAGALAGVVAAGAYLAEQELDLRLFNYPTDDRLLLGRLVTGDNDAAKPIGFTMHLTNGAIAGTAYTLVAEPILPGSPLAKGLVFILTETLALYPLALIEDHHPAIKDGTLASYWTMTGFAQQLLRHLAFGAVLGPAAARLLHR